MLVMPRFRNWTGRALAFQRPDDPDATPLTTRASDLMRDFTAAFGDAKFWSRDQLAAFFKGHAFAQTMQSQGAVGRAQLLAVLPKSSAAMPDFNVFASELQGVKEVVRWDLYSYKVYPAAGTLQLLFFDQDEGLATAGRLDTNMEAAGQLPGGQFQIVVAQGIEYWPAAADVFVASTALGKAGIEGWNVMTQGWLENEIGRKTYGLNAPLFSLPACIGPGTFVNGPTSSANVYAAQFVSNGSPDNKARYNLDPPWGIIEKRPFRARLRYNSLQTTTTAGRIGVRYLGWQIRVVG